MSLIKCHECSKEISDKAKACPHCGAPTNLDSDTNPKKRVFKTYLKLFIPIYLTTGIIYLLIPNSFEGNYTSFLMEPGRWGYTRWWFLIFTPLLVHLYLIINEIILLTNNNRRKKKGRK